MRKITADFVEEVFRQRKELEKRAHLIEDLEQYLRALPYYKKRPEGGTTMDKPWTRDIIMHNASIFLDNQFNMVHQGDITVETLRGIKKRIGSHKVFIFWEHNPNKPMCGAFDLTALRADAGMARPFGKAKILLELADIILERNECIINNAAFAETEENCRRAGFKVTINWENYW